MYPDTQIDLITLVLNTVGLTALAVFVIWPQIERLGANVCAVMMGVFLGLIALMQLLTPVELAPGIIIDLRNLPVGLAAAFFGLRGAIPAFLIAAAFRIWIGGDGAVAGVAGLALSVAGGLTWAWASRGAVVRGPVWLMLLGPFISINMLAVALLPPQFQMLFLQTCAPIILVLYATGGATVGALIEHRLRNIRDTALFDRSRHIDADTGFLTPDGFAMAELCRRADTPIPTSIAALQIRLRHLDWVARTFGDKAQRHVVAALAQRLQREVRPDDLITRTGVDSFCVVLPDIGGKTSADIRDCVLNALSADPVEVPDVGPVRVTVDVTLAWQDRTCDIQPVIARAQAALTNAHPGVMPVHFVPAQPADSLFDVTERMISTRKCKVQRNGSG